MASLVTPARALAALGGAILLAAASVLVLVVRPDLARHPADPLLLDDPAALTSLDEHGLSFARIVGRKRLRVIAETIARDVAELTRGEGSHSPRRPFKAEWLEGGRFELVGIVNRLDRRVFDPSGCGEVRLVYRLTLKNPRRPRTRLPMTVNVRIPQPMPQEGARDCRSVAARWLARENVRDLLGALPEPATIEINYQSVHVPASRPDMDDSAEYVLRAFKVDRDSLVEDRLFNTPRADLSPGDRERLVAWIREHLAEIDAGSAVLPDEWLAVRAVSVSPRGLARIENRPFAKLLAHAAFAELPLAERTLVRTPELLVRRLDETTCTGCHQSRGIAGFHLLGEERDADATFNALAVGHSPHLAADLRWRRIDLDAAARGERAPARPFASHPDGLAGAACGLVPGLSSLRCDGALTCRDVHGATMGVCALTNAAGPGDPCEDARLEPAARPEGPRVTALAADVTCPSPSGEMKEGKFCAPNWLGFTGGMCSERCDRAGATRSSAICAPMPAAGYEADCFTSREPIERCLGRHFATALVATCDRETPCRDDYGCARVAGAPRGKGACVPPYFIFQARVDGPLLDR